jgi:hypothetical protein
LLKLNSYTLFIVVKALAQDAEPDHDTIAHFISSHAEVVKGLFAQRYC